MTNLTLVLLPSDQQYAWRQEVGAFHNKSTIRTINHDAGTIVLLGFLCHKHK